MKARTITWFTGGFKAQPNRIQSLDGMPTMTRSPEFDFLRAEPAEAYEVPMTRPIDETWRVRNSVSCTDDVYCAEAADYIFRTDAPAGHPDYPAAHARARLAAQAPAMARLLLHRMGDRNCEYCGEKVDRVTETGIVDPVYKGETLCLSDPAHHRKDCVLVAALRAAGAL